MGKSSTLVRKKRTSDYVGLINTKKGLVSHMYLHALYSTWFGQLLYNLVSGPHVGIKLNLSTFLKTMWTFLGYLKSVLGRIRDFRETKTSLEGRTVILTLARYFLQDIFRVLPPKLQISGNRAIVNETRQCQLFLLSQLVGCIAP